MSRAPAFAPDPGSRAAALLEAARAARGFMPDEEGLHLSDLARRVADDDLLPHRILEVGAYCGRSTLYLAAGLAASEPRGGALPILFSLDHHHGSEENQAGWAHHEPDLVDARTGLFETLPHWRRAVDDAGAGDLVVGVVGFSAQVAANWETPLGAVFIDGGHGDDPAWADYRGWSPLVAPGGLLAIHDVFADPRDGGRPPYEIYCAALDSGLFREEPALSSGSLRVLRRGATKAESEQSQRS